MKKIIALIAPFTLAACVGQEFYVRQNVTFDRYERDTVACRTLATQAVPTNTQVGWAPYVGIYSVDTNEGLRASNHELCMRDRGYQPVEIPYCSGEAATAATQASRQPRNRNERMRIASNSCYITTAEGSYLFTP